MIRIYKLYDERNSDIVRYIGKTNRTNLNIRLIEHICHAKTRNYHVSNWINKLNRENIKPSIKLLDICYDEDWEFWEKFYIMKYKTDKLTNIECGGKSETIRKYIIKGTNKNTKAVEQLDINFNLINTFKSVADASRKLNLNKHVIAATCRGKQSKAYGYRWKFKDDLEVRLKENSNKKAVIQMDLEGREIVVFESIKQAANTLKICAKSIGCCVRGVYKQSGKFKWKLKN